MNVKSALKAGSSGTNDGPKTGPIIVKCPGCPGGPKNN